MHDVLIGLVVLACSLVALLAGIAWTATRKG